MIIVIIIKSTINNNCNWYYVNTLSHSKNTLNKSAKLDGSACGIPSSDVFEFYGYISWLSI